jgi:hypothetical protein
VTEGHLPVVQKASQPLSPEREGRRITGLEEHQTGVVQ